jgi:hypothetical protein
LKAAAAPKDFVPRAALEKSLLAVPASELARWSHEIAVLAQRHGMEFFPTPGKGRPIHVTSRPWLRTRPQHDLLQRTFLALDRGTRALPALAHADREAAFLLPLDTRERRWMRSFLGPPFNRPQTLLGRVDCAIDLGSASWRDSLLVLETNMVGVGASYYSWCASRIVHEVIGPWLARTFPGRRFRPDDDVLDLILNQVKDHGETIGVKAACVCLLEEAVDSGPAEFVRMAELLRRRGHDVITADPGEIRVKRGRMYAGDKAVDFLYRDPTAVNLLELGDEGRNLTGIKWAFRENRVVSGLAGEFDQKGALEIFTSARWRKRFPSADAAIFRKHVAWTRVVREMKTDGPDGREIDLTAFLRRARERLVLKPNRDYGGHGINFGREIKPAAWDRLINRAVREAPGWVAQTLASPVEEIYPTGDAKIPWDKRVTIGGFTGTPRGVAMLARLSKSRVVNITRDGGVAGVIAVD